MTSNLETNYQDIIRVCFSQDEELLTIWHINAGKGKESCVNRTIDEVSKFINFKFFTIKNENDIVGFYGTEQDCFLSTFFVSPKYRKKEFMGKIWSLMTKDFNQVYHSSVYSKNTKAISFFEKNGGKIIANSTHLGEPFVVFEFIQEILCH